MDERRRENRDYIARLDRLQGSTAAEFKGLHKRIDRIEPKIDDVSERVAVIEVLTRGAPNVAATSGKLASLLVHDLRAMLLIAVVVGIILGNAGITPQGLLASIVEIFK